MEPFHSINVDGSFNVFISQAVSQSVVVATQENILEHFKMSVMDGVLYLSMAPGSYMSYDLAVKLAMPTVSSMEMEGSGDVEIGTFVGIQNLTVKLDGSGDVKGTGVLEVLSEATINLQGSGDIELKLKAKDVELILDGSGDIDVTGQTNKLVANLNGSGDIDAMELEAIDCEAKLDGSGKIKVFASSMLKANLQGSGDIRYDGKPEVEAKIDGSGTIQAD
ncbi:MAG: DUF2807 domain-containing protein [Flavobacteriales bacterium]|nr:DUF2807 domain-containing protein [Flavobacteriales bacterium]